LDWYLTVSQEKSFVNHFIEMIEGDYLRMISFRVSKNLSLYPIRAHIKVGAYCLPDLGDTPLQKFSKKWLTEVNQFSRGGEISGLKAVEVDTTAW
jgi:hypothetical protein